MISILSNQSQQQKSSSTQQNHPPSTTKIIVNDINIKQKHWPDYIDLNNIQKTASLQYLHNYTYLQYCIFPELFQVFINTMESNQLVQQLNSYIGTFMDFFIDGIPYQTAYDLNVLMIEKNRNISEIRQIIKECIVLNNNDQYIANKLHKLVPLIPTLKKDNTNSKQKQSPAIEQHQQMLLKIIDDIKTKKHVVKGLFKLICLLVQKILFKKQSFTLIVQCPMPKYLLHSVVMELERQSDKKVVKIERQVENNLQQTQRLLRQILSLKIVPIYIQVYGLYMLITNGRMKMFDMTGWQWDKILDKMELSVEIQRIIIMLNSKIQKQSHYIQIENQDFQQLDDKCIEKSIGLGKMVTIIKQCFSLYDIQRAKQLQRQLPKQLKQLSIENIEKLSRQFAKLISQKQPQKKTQKQFKLYNNGDNNYKNQNPNYMELQQRQNKQFIIDLEQSNQNNGSQRNKDNYRTGIDQQQRVKQQSQNVYQKEQNNYINRRQQLKAQFLKQAPSILGSLPQAFLLPYNKFLSYLHRYQQQQQMTIIKTSQYEIYDNNDDSIMQRVGQLFGYLNSKMRSIVGLDCSDLDKNESLSKNARQQKGIVKKIKKKVNDLQLEIGLVLEILTIIQQNNYVSHNSNQGQNMSLDEYGKESRISKVAVLQGQKQQNIKIKCEQEQLNRKLVRVKKVKHSLYVNLLSLKILQDTVNGSNCREQQQKQKSLQIEQKQKLSMKIISEMFDSVFQLSSQAIGICGSRSDNKQTEFNNGSNNRTDSNTVLINNMVNASLPSLQTVLYLFSALQLWVEMNPHNKSQSQQLSQQQNQQSKLLLQQCIITNKQVHTFLSNVINKYSQPNITIPSQQLVYVKYIIEMFEMFNLFFNLGEYENSKSNNKVVEKLGRLTKLCQERDYNCNESVRVQELINIQLCLQQYIKKMIPSLITYCLCKQQSKQQQRQQSSKSQTFLSFDNLLTLSINQQTLACEQLTTYINKDLLDKLQSGSLSKNKGNKLKEKPLIINLNESVMSENNEKLPQQVSDVEFTIMSREMFSTVKNVFRSLVNKYAVISQLRRQLVQIDSTNSIKRQSNNLTNRQSSNLTYRQSNNLTSWWDNDNRCEFEYLFDKCQQKCLWFMIEASQIVIDSNEMFLHVHSSYNRQILLSSAIMSSIYQQQLQSLYNKLTTYSIRLTKSIQQKLINLRLIIYKLSPQQIQYLVKQQQWELNEDNKNKLLDKIKTITKVIDSLLGFAILLRAYQQWMLMETMLKIEQISLRTKQQNINYQSEQPHSQRQTLSSSSFHLLRLITVMSWLNSNSLPMKKFQTNFQYLQKALQSNIMQTQLICPLQSIVDNPYKLVLTKLLLTRQVEQQLKYVQSYQFMQFIYQFIPFDIDNEKQEKSLLNLIQNYVQHQDNHLYISQQKLQKINLVKLYSYIQLLKTSNPKIIIKQIANNKSLFKNQTESILEISNL